MHIVVNEFMSLDGVVQSPGDAIEAVKELKAQPGRNIAVMGSSDLARQLIAADLVDEYVLMIEPVVFGGGKRLFPGDGSMRSLDLIGHQATSTGVHICTYRSSEPVAAVS